MFSRKRCFTHVFTKTLLYTKTFSSRSVSCVHALVFLSRVNSHRGRERDFLAPHQHNQYTISAKHYCSVRDASRPSQLPLVSPNSCCYNGAHICLTKGKGLLIHGELIALSRGVSSRRLRRRKQGFSSWGWFRWLHDLFRHVRAKRLHLYP